MEEVDSYARELNVPREALVRKALERTNVAVMTQWRRTRIVEISRYVTTGSRAVDAEFSEVEPDPAV